MLLLSHVLFLTPSGGFRPPPPTPPVGRMRGSKINNDLGNQNCVPPCANLITFFCSATFLILSLALIVSLALTLSLADTLSLTPPRSRQRGVWGGGGAPQEVQDTIHATQTTYFVCVGDSSVWWIPGRSNTIVCVCAQYALGVCVRVSCALFPCVIA